MTARARTRSVVTEYYVCVILTVALFGFLAAVLR